MSKTIRELTEDLLAAPSACAEVKETAQNYLDAIGGENEAAAAKTFVAELGEEGAKNILIHAKEIKSNGAKYCDCPACAACEALLEKKDEILK